MVSGGFRNPPKQQAVCGDTSRGPRGRTQVPNTEEKDASHRPERTRKGFWICRLEVGRRVMRRAVCQGRMLHTYLRIYHFHDSFGSKPTFLSQWPNTVRPHAGTSSKNSKRWAT